jgi:hypothetical protein
LPGLVDQRGGEGIPPRLENGVEHRNRLHAPSLGAGAESCTSRDWYRRDLDQKGHTYRIVVSYLQRRRPIWVDGKDRLEESMNLFYEWIGPVKSRRIRLAVMDM